MVWLRDLSYWVHSQRAKRRYPQPPLELQLSGARVILRMGDPADWKAWRNLRDLSRNELIPWEPSWPPNSLDYTYFCGLLRRQWRDWRQGTAYNFLIFLAAKDASTNSGALIGGITLNSIERGIAQKGTLGYWLGTPYTGHGYMQEAAGLVVDFALTALRLNRVEASCLPTNAPSKKLLQQLGFHEEGFAKAYLMINGAWADHILWGKTYAGRSSTIDTPCPEAPTT